MDKKPSPKADNDHPSVPPPEAAEKSLRDNFRDMVKNIAAQVKDKTDTPQKMIDIFKPNEVERAVEKGDMANVTRAFAAGQIKTSDEKWLLLAIKNHQGEVARFLLQAGASPNAVSGDISLLEWAALSRKKELVEDLVRHGASLTQRDQKNGATILHKMAEQGRHELLWYLVDQGADILAETKSGMTPLMIVVSRGEHAEIAKALETRPALKPVLQAVTTVQGKNLLQHALLAEKYAAAAFLLAEDADVDHQDKEGKTALHYAARGRDVKILAEILAKSKNVNAVDHDGASALLEALLVPNRAKRIEILNALLAGGVAMTAFGEKELSLLSVAIEMMPKEMEKIEVLLTHGAKTDERDRNGYTPFHYALAKMGAKELLALLKYDCDVNQPLPTAPDRPLLAVLTSGAFYRHDKRSILAAFIAAGARMEARDTTGKNFFDHLQDGHEDVFRRKEALALYRLAMAQEAQRRSNFMRKHRP
jgi:ankyrin repeat protein